VFGEAPGVLSNLACLGALQRGVGRARCLVGTTCRLWRITACVGGGLRQRCGGGVPLVVVLTCRVLYVLVSVPVDGC
jgi:hypothetical protein